MARTKGLQRKSRNFGFPSWTAISISSIRQDRALFPGLIRPIERCIAQLFPTDMRVSRKCMKWLGLLQSSAVPGWLTTSG
jgi:hypothetical protein